MSEQNIAGKPLNNILMQLNVKPHLLLLGRGDCGGGMVQPQGWGICIVLIMHQCKLPMMAESPKKLIWVGDLITRDGGLCILVLTNPHPDPGKAWDILLMI